MYCQVHVDTGSPRRGERGRAHELIGENVANNVKVGPGD